MMTLAFLLVAADLPEEVERVQRARLEQLRAEVASELPLQAYDLIDELVYRWRREPPFGTPTPVVLAHVSVPLGMGSGLRGLVETHLLSVMIENPETQMKPVHCAACTSVMVRSGKKSTVVGRGIDFPDALESLSVASGSKHALFIDLEAEGTELVLRAKITSIEPDLPIVSAMTLSNSVASPSLLREGGALKSAQDARDEYLDLLAGQRRYRFPLRVAVRRYATPSTQQTSSTSPLVWLQGGVEFDISPGGQWVAGLNAGITRETENDSTGWLLQARIARLLTGRTRSLTSPDIYFFTGLSSISLRGPTAAAFRNETPSLTDLLTDATGQTPTASFFSFIAGLEFQVRNRLGFSAFVEATPGLTDAPSIGRYASLGFDIETIGAEVTFWF
ncbi:MAG: hypothetical protein AAF658_12645 [Myxococcota bacterium]